MRARDVATTTEHRPGHPSRRQADRARVPAGASEVARLQRLAGNQAVIGLLALQRKKGKPKANRSLSSLTKSLEKQVAKATGGITAPDQDAVKPLATAVFGKDGEYYAKLLVYKLAKHCNEKGKRDLYSLTTPKASHARIFELAWQKRDGELVAFLTPGEWKRDRAGLEKRGLDEPGYFIDHCLLDGMRRTDFGKQTLQAMVEDKVFLGNLATKAPGEFARLTAAMPVLKLVSGVETEVRADQVEGKVMTQAAVIDKLFDSFIANRGIEVGYSGTKIDENNVILTGQHALDIEHREKDLKPLMPDLPAKLSTACHQLLGLFQSVLKSYPGLEALKMEPGDEPAAVLTQPLGTLPGGLIASGFGGNVFDEHGSPTGQIFFSGNQDKLPKSHSWVILDGVPYDPVLGTRDAGVDGAINGRFVFNDDPEVATETGGTRVLTRDRTLKPSGEYGLTAAWRLTG